MIEILLVDMCIMGWHNLYPGLESSLSSVQFNPVLSDSCFFDNLKSRPYPFPTSPMLSHLEKFPLESCRGSKS